MMKVGGKVRIARAWLGQISPSRSHFASVQSYDALNKTYHQTISYIIIIAKKNKTSSITSVCLYTCSERGKVK